MDHDSDSQSTSTSASASSSQSNGPATFMFTASQAAYMNQELEEYRNLTGLLAKKKFANSVTAALLEDIHEISGIKPSEQRKAILEEAVLQWFEENGKADVRPPKRVWASRWNARLVFNAIHTGIVKYVAKRIYHGKSIPDLRYMYDNEAEFLHNYGQSGDEQGEEIRDGDGGGDGDVEDEGLAGSPKKTGKKGKGKETGTGTGANTYFVKYQDAITLFWTVLTPEEIQKYEDLCAKWKEIGPPRSEQRKTASKHLHTRLYDFAEAALRDCGAVVHFWVGYEDAGGVRRAYDVECHLGPPDVPDFQSTANEVMQESGLRLMWGRHVDRVLNGLYGTPGVESEQTAVPRRQFGKPIIAMELDDDGYPILPPINSKPAHMQHQEWISCVLRSFFARHWAIAKKGQALPPTTCRASSVQWKGVRTLWTECVDEEILPESMKEYFVEPSDAPLHMKETFFNVLYSRQQDPNVSQTFAFKAIPVKVKGKWESAPIARRVDSGTTSPAAGPSMPLPPRPKKPRRKPQKKKVSFEKTIPLKDNPPREPTPTTTPTSSLSSTTTSPDCSPSSSTETSSEQSGSSSTTTSSENPPSNSSTTTSSDNADHSETTTSSEASTSDRSSSTSSSDETSTARPKKISFPTLKDLETPLPPAASSSSEDETLITLLESAHDDAGEADSSRVKRRRLEVPPVDEAALKTPRLTRAERAKLEAEARVSTRSRVRGGTQGAPASSSRGGGTKGGARSKRRGTNR
ncbi:hypothetical protein CC2G_002207 [Coprinopsis cinerea AmutBmut pab1-1]|nr:hypothetical protein CC2G_002207 [Coprinopsis cinerea AmutBmut pab1-1]